MATPTFVDLVGAKSAATVLANLMTGSPAVKTAISATLNSSLQTQLAAALASMPVLASLSTKINLGPADIVAANDLTTKAFLKQQLEPIVAKDPAMEQAVDAEIAKLSGAGTVGSLLQLNTPLNEHPLFKADAQKIGIASILATSSTLAANQQLEADFVNRYTSFKGTSQNFWNQLTTEPEFKAAVPELQFTLQVSALLANNTPLVSVLRQQFQPKQLQDLTKLTPADWTKLLNTPVNAQLAPIPASTAGATRDQQVTNYVNSLIGQLKSLFPTIYIAQDMGAQPTVNVSLVKAVLAANPGLDPSERLQANVNLSGLDPQQATAAMAALRQEINAFPTTSAADFLSGTAFNNQVRQSTATILVALGPTNFDIRTTPIDAKHVTALQQLPANLQGPVTVQLQSLQRLSRLTLDYSKIYALQGSGQHSAFSVSQMPQASFLNQFSSSLGGRAVAQQIYANAINVFAQVTNLRMRIYEAFNGVTPQVLGDISDGTQQVLQSALQDGLPNWTTLFGSPGACQCCDCHSAYGPAAYFVDLMRFLKNSSAQPQGPSALDVLQSRRPDLWYLKLNCENSDTELPFIDLVNEILETFVDHRGHLLAASKNTPIDATSNELSVNPEYTIQAVYDANHPLASDVFPFSLPFNRYLETARVCFKNLNITREELMRTFSVNGNPSNLAIACERLRISSQELPIIDGSSSKTLAEFYGFPVGTAEATLITPTNPYLGLVQNFLNATGLAFSDLVNLLETRFLNPNQQVTLLTQTTVQDASGNPIPADTCDLTYTTFQNLYVSSTSIVELPKVPSTSPVGETPHVFPLEFPGFLEKAYRFIRLWRKTRWTMGELDKAFTALRVSDTSYPLGGNNISDGVLQAIAQLNWLRDTLSLTITQLLGLWSNIDTDGRDSLYMGLFQNKAVTNPVDLAFQLTYLAPLSSTALPGLPFPLSARSQTSYSTSDQILSFTGSMTDEQQQDLFAWAGTSAGAILAVQNLSNQRWYQGTDVAVPTGQSQQPPISASLNTILAALQIGADDLTAIAVDAGLIPSTGNLTSTVTIAIGGSTTANDTVTLEVSLNSTMGPPGPVKYVVQPGDDLSAVASAIAKGIKANPALTAAGISAGATGPIINLTVAHSANPYPTFVMTPSPATVGGTATETATVSPCPHLRLATLSVFYRYAVLAQALALSVADLISLKALSGIDPFLKATTVPTTNSLVQFVKAAQMVASSSFSVAQINYLYRALPDVAASLPPLVLDEEQLLAGLSSGLQTIAAANAYVPDPNGTALRKGLGATLAPDQVEPTMNLINGTVVYTTPLANAPTGPTPQPVSEPGQQVSFISTVTVGGNPTPGDTVTLSVITTSGGFPISFTYSVRDTSSSIASSLEAQINSNPTLMAAGITASITGPALSISAPSSLSTPPVVTAAVSTASGTAISGAVTVGVAGAGTGGVAGAGSTTTVTIGPSGVAPGNIVTISVALSSTPGFPVNLAQTVGEDTLGSIANALAAEINAEINNDELPGILSASVAGATITITAAPSAAVYPNWAGASALSSGAQGTEAVGIANALQCAGPMSDATKTALLAFSSDSNFVPAVNDLYNQAQNVLSQNLSFLPAQTAMQELIDAPPAAVADRYNFVLQSLLVDLRTTQSESLVKQTLSQALNLDPALVALLLQGDSTSDTPALLPSQSLSAQPGMIDFVGGLLAFYYSDNQFATLLSSRIDPGVDLDGTEVAFGSAQWFGQIVPPSTDAYTFSLLISPSGYQCQLYVNGQNCSQTPQISLQAGQVYDLQLYASGTTATPGAPTLQLQWSNSKTISQTVPAAAFVLGASPSSRGTNSSPAFVQGGAYSTLSLLNRIALLVNGFSMKASEIEYLSAHSTDFQGVDPGNSGNTMPFELSALPLDYFPTPANAGNPNPLQSSIDVRARAFFNQWQRLFDLYKFKASLPSSGNVDLFDIFQAAATSNSSTALTISNTILEATGWSAQEFSILSTSQTDPASKTQIGFAQVDANFKNEISLVELAACMALVSRFGVSAQQLFLWANNEPDAAMAQDIQNTIKAKYDDSTWFQVGKSLNDKIRASSRNALVSYILANSVKWGLEVDGAAITIPDQLYEFFLIDVQMGACMQTSRIVQATATIQQFVQRCLLNLEPLAPPASFDLQQWAWMQNYRVWEANREVFLYPENYIVPTLRDDMTPPFDDLMNSLLQSPITDDNVSQAYIDYLYDLNNVNQLEMCGIYWQQESPTATVVGAATGMDNQNTSAINTLHVFGRTAGTQTQYYYRQFLSTDSLGGLASGSWTPWEELNLQISGDHLIPVVWAGRVYLFWPSFTTTADPSNQFTTPAAASTPGPAETDLEIGLSWSEYRQGAWTPPQAATNTVNPVAFNPYVASSAELDYSQFFFTTNIDQSTGNLIVTVIDTNPTLDPENQVPNPSFANVQGGVAPSPWTSQGTVDFGMVGTAVVPGTVYVVPSMETSGPAYVMSGPTSALPGQTWIASVQIVSVSISEEVPAGVPAAYVLIQFLDKGSNVIRSNQYEYVVPFDPSAPVQLEAPISLSVNCVAPDQTAFVNMQFGVDNFTPNFDDVDLVFSQPSLATIPPVLGTFTISLTPGGNSSSDEVSGNSAIPSPIPNGSFSYMWVEGTKALSLTDLQERPMPVLQTGLQSYQLLFPQDQFADLLSGSIPQYDINPFFYSDSQRTYLAVLAPLIIYDAYLQLVNFQCHWHPFVPSFIKTLNWQGIGGLLTLSNQILSNDSAGVIDGLVLSVSSTLAPSLLSGNLIAQGQPFAFVNPSLPPAPPNATSSLYFSATPYNNFYYTPSSPENPGDALIGTVVTNANSVTSVVGPTDLQPTQFQQNYTPFRNSVNMPYPLENVDFSAGGAYSIYNWELFFHIPLLVATQLSQNQQFEDAMTWFQYIFNPTTNSAAPIPQRFWNFLPFAVDTEPGRIQDLLASLHYTGNDPQIFAEQSQLVNQILEWQNNPFSPFVIARLRPIAFMKKTVMAYLDNLIAWGDSLFSQNTRESINEATQIYVLAQQILGPQPQTIPQPGTVKDLTYSDIQGQLDSFSNISVQLENAFPFSSSASANPNSSGLSGNGSLTTPYFCIPGNDQLLGYWDTVADRLYKIRHCMNIQGQVEQLALFAPPINPALLVAATAAGVDLSSVLSDMNSPPPNYRFTFMVQKALELCAEVRSFGGALLSALEKNDGEALSLLRASQETKVLQAVLQIKQLQIQEANANLAASQASLAVTQSRIQYYQGLLANSPSAFETTQITELTQGQVFQQDSQANELASGIAALIPNATIGAEGISSPVATFTFGGIDLQAMFAAAGRAKSMLASFHSFNANMASILGGWDRRKQEWAFQLQTANLEATQINQQIAASQVRVQIAQADLQNQQLQIANAQAIQAFLNDKYTNQRLYSWMIGQLAGIYFQCYQMAYGLAKRAEFCFRFELGLQTSNFIQFGYWDSLKKGLLAGEGLYTDLKRMEIGYLDQNNREYEIARNISLVLLDPIALITLKETGQCSVSLPEAFFDMDYPGHYMRRIRSLSLTIPCVSGPYTSVNCTLTLVQSKIRWDSTVGSSYMEQPVASDARFLYNFAATQSIATSTAQNDSGLFEVNFRDERYLPFEGTGAVSQWLISMPQECNAFDFETITDVILNLKYTAREGGAALRDAALKSALMPLPQPQSALLTQPAKLPSKQTNLIRYFSLKHEFPTEWYQFLNPTDPSKGQVMAFALTRERFPFRYRGMPIKVTGLHLFLRFKDAYPSAMNQTSTPSVDYQNGGSYLQYRLAPAGAAPIPASQTPPLTPDPAFQGTPDSTVSGLSVPVGLKPWQIAIVISSTNNPASSLQLTVPLDATGSTPTYQILNPALIEDLFLVCRYSTG
jgi:hypothetical protein